LIGLLVVNSEALCPSGIRFANAYSTTQGQLNLLINNVVLVSNANYRTVSAYASTTPGTKNVVIQTSGSPTNQINSFTFTAVPNVYYTIAITGNLTGPLGELLFDSSPFVFHETVYPPNNNKYRGRFHRLDESSNTRQLAVFVNNARTSLVPGVVAKTAVLYPEVDFGSVTFTVQSAYTGTPVNNSAGQIQQLTTFVNPGTIYDIFTIGNDAANIPTEITPSSTTPTYDVNSGCTLATGFVVLPNNSPVQSTYTPYYCSASTLATGIAFLLALVALFF